MAWDAVPEQSWLLKLRPTPVFDGLYPALPASSLCRYTFQVRRLTIHQATRLPAHEHAQAQTTPDLARLAASIAHSHPHFNALPGPLPVSPTATGKAPAAGSDAHRPRPATAASTCGCERSACYSPDISRKAGEVGGPRGGGKRVKRHTMSPTLSCISVCCFCLRKCSCVCVNVCVCECRCECVYVTATPIFFGHHKHT